MRKIRTEKMEKSGRQKEDRQTEGSEEIEIEGKLEWARKEHSGALPSEPSS